MGRIRLTTLKRLALHCFCEADIQKPSDRRRWKTKINAEFRRLTRRLCELNWMDEDDGDIPLHHMPRYIEHSILGANTFGNNDIEAIRTLFTPSDSVAAVDEWLLASDTTSADIIDLLLERKGLTRITRKWPSLCSHCDLGHPATERIFGDSANGYQCITCWEKMRLCNSTRKHIRCLVLTMFSG